MGAHVFVVDADSYPVHRDRLFCGIKNPNKLSKIKKTGHVRPNSSYYGLIADLVTLRKGDYIIFYQMRKDEAKFDRGFRGIFKVVSEPFFDESDIDGIDSSVGKLGSKDKKVLGKCPHCQTNLSEKAHAKTGEKICRNCEKELDFHILPNRILIEPIKLFEDPIDDNTAYIDRNFISEKLPVLWTMLFRKTSGAGRARSITHILPEEYNKLKIIFEANCNVSTSSNFKPYKPKNPQKLDIPLDTDEKGELKVEAFLEAWLMARIGKENIEGLNEVLGNSEEIEYFGNNVLYGIGGEKVDLLIIHKKESGRYKATVIELKKGKLKESDVDQINDYAKWMAQLVFGNDDKESKIKIQPVLIGFQTPQKIVNYANNLITETKRPIIMNYKVDGDIIKFEKVSTQETLIT